MFYYPYFFSHLLISFCIFHINHHRKEFIIVYSPGHVQLVFCIIKANICYISENALLVGLSWRANSALVSEDTNHRNTENIWKIGHKARYLFGLDSESKSDIPACFALKINMHFMIMIHLTYFRSLLWRDMNWVLRISLRWFWTRSWCVYLWLAKTYLRSMVEFIASDSPLLCSAWATKPCLWGTYISEGRVLILPWQI